MSAPQKFRARDRNGKLYYFSVFDIYSADPDGEHFYIDQVSCQLVRATLQQYTGLTDKNGVEIYEGDVVRATKNYPGNETILFNLTFRANTATFAFRETLENSDGDRYFYDALQIRDVEVVGDIYSNPALLKEAA